MSRNTGTILQLIMKLSSVPPSLRRSESHLLARSFIRRTGALAIFTPPVCAHIRGWVGDLCSHAIHAVLPKAPSIDCVPISRPGRHLSAFQESTYAFIAVPSYTSFHRSFGFNSTKARRQNANYCQSFLWRSSPRGKQLTCLGAQRGLLGRPGRLPGLVFDLLLASYQLAHRAAAREFRVVVASVFHPAHSRSSSICCLYAIDVCRVNPTPSGRVQACVVS